MNHSDIERKVLAFDTREAARGEFAGYASVFHTIDDSPHGDIVAPGAFDADLAEFLASGFIGGLNHNWDQPIGRPVEAREDARGLFVRAALSDTGAAREVRTLLRDGVIGKLSIGFRILGWELLETEAEVFAYWRRWGYAPSAGDRAKATAGARLLTRVRLFEVSPVAVPANRLAAITEVKGGGRGMQGLARAAQRIEERRGELAALFARHRQGDEYSMPVEAVEEVNRRNDELAGLVREHEEAKRLSDLAERNTAALEQMRQPRRLPVSERTEAGCARPVETRSLGDLFVGSVAYREFKGGRSPVAVIPDLEVKTLFSTSAGWDPEDLRRRRVLFDEQEMPRVVDLYPKTTTRMSTVLWMEETTYTNNAAEVAEAGSYPEAALTVTEQSSEVRKISVLLPVTDEVFEDEERARDYVNNRLRNMLFQRLDQQLLVGNGTAPNLRGVNNLAGINTQAKGTDPTPDAIYKGIVLIRTNGFTEPNAVVMHPNDFQDLRLLRTADGVYIWGSPSERGNPTIWGLPIISTTYQTEGTAVAGDWANFGELATRRGIEFEVTNAHSTYFAEGKMAIRCDLRVAAIHYRAKAFCKITGI